MINVREIFGEKSYVGVEGGILEGFGKLFPDNTRLFVYPELDENGDIADFTSLMVPDNLRYLYRHLLENKFIFGIDCSNADYLKIYSREVLNSIQNNSAGWQEALPAGIADIIENQALLGYRPGND